MNYRAIGLVALLLAALTASAQKRPQMRGRQAASTQAAASAQQKAPAPPIVLRGGRLLTVSHGVIDGGVLVMENGKIAAIGAAGSVAIPQNARVIDVAGMTVYPGLIDSETWLGLSEIEADPMTNDLVETSDEVMPHMHVYDAFHAESERIPIIRVNGITNAIVSPTARDTLPGQSSFIQLDGRDRDEMLLVRDIALPLNFTGDQRRRQEGAPGLGHQFPSTRMGMAAQLRQVFLDAQEYARKMAEAEKKSSGSPAKGAKAKPEEKDGDEEAEGERSRAPKHDLKLEALVPYIQGKKPVLLGANEASDLKTALDLAREFKLKIILHGLTHAQGMLDEIAALKAPVVLGPIYDTPKDYERYDAVFKLPAELYERGVKIAFSSHSLEHIRNLPYQAGYAVAFGLPWEEALKAITLNPAEIWGVADQLGSLDVGKTANVVVANGDPLDVKTEVKRVFIQGRELPMDNRQTRLRDQYMQR